MEEVVRRRREEREKQREAIRQASEKSRRAAEAAAALAAGLTGIVGADAVKKLCSGGEMDDLYTCTSGTQARGGQVEVRGDPGLEPGLYSPTEASRMSCWSAPQAGTLQRDAWCADVAVAPPAAAVVHGASSQGARQQAMREGSAACRQAEAGRVDRGEQRGWCRWGVKRNERGADC